MNVFRNQPPVFLTSVNAAQLKQVRYEKDRIINSVAGGTTRERDHR
jgi:hypothetical protein